MAKKPSLELLTRIELVTSSLPSNTRTLFFTFMAKIKGKLGFFGVLVVTKR